MRQRVRFSQRVHWSDKPPISYLMEQAVANPSIISLAAGLVDQPSLPADEVRSVVQTILGDSERAARTLQYGTTDGDLRLRRLVAERLNGLDGAAPGHEKVSAERIVVGTGSQQLLYLVAEVLLDPGDIVLVTVPGYFVFMGALQSFGVRTLAVPTDESGLLVDACEATLRKIDQQGELDRVKLIYDVTYFNNPTGWSLSASRREQLVALARRWSARQRIHVLEDAAYRELRYGGDDVPSMMRFDPDGQTVIYAGTFSKSFAPGLKTGYIVLPRDFIEPLMNQKGHQDFGSSNFNQQVLAEALATGGYARHLDRLRVVYGQKRQAMLAALSEYLEPVADSVSWTKPDGGLYVWVRVPEHISTAQGQEFFKRCIAAGVLYVPGRFCFPVDSETVPDHYLRLSFGLPTAEQITEGVRRLAAVLVPMLATTSVT